MIWYDVKFTDTKCQVVLKLELGIVSMTQTLKQLTYQLSHQPALFYKANPTIYPIPTLHQIILIQCKKYVHLLLQLKFSKSRLVEGIVRCQNNSQIARHVPSFTLYMTLQISVSLLMRSGACQGLLGDDHRIIVGSDHCQGMIQEELILFWKY